MHDNHTHCVGRRLMFFSVVILVLPRVAPKRGVVLAEFAEQNSTWPGGTGGTT